MAYLLRSRKFWLMVFDVAVSTATYLISNSIDPALAEKIIWLIGAWQPVIIAVIVGIAVEDAAEKGNPANAISDIEGEG